MLTDETDKKIHFSNCIFLIFNQDDISKIANSDQQLLIGMLEKWKKNHKDPQGERIHFIFIGKDDLDRNKYPRFANNPKFSPLKDVNPYSHIYIMGHYYLEGNRLEISDDRHDQERANFPMDKIGDILLECIDHPFVCMNRNMPELIGNPLEQQKLKISLILCDSATGLLRNKTREHLDSFASHFLNYLYNHHEKFYLDCILTGIIGYVVPMPGKSYEKLTENEEETLTSNFHKRYRGAEVIDGEIFHVYRKPIPGSDRWKITFTSAPDTTTDQIQSSQIKIVEYDAAAWNKTLQIRIKNKQNKIYQDLGFFKSFIETYDISNQKEIEEQIKKGIIDLAAAKKAKK